MDDAKLDGILELQRHVPHFLWIDPAYGDGGSSVWLYNGHFIAVTPLDADFVKAHRAIATDERFATAAGDDVVATFRARLSEQGNGASMPRGIADSLVAALADRQVEETRRRTFTLEPFDDSRAGVEYRGVDPQTREHLWAFSVIGSSESEAISSETLATILDLQWDDPQLIGFFRKWDATESDVWLYRGHYVSVDNRDAERTVVQDAIVADEQFAVPMDKELLKEHRRALPENRFQREAREDAEREGLGGERRRVVIPERVRHEVWRRDQGRCVECGSRELLEYDHIVAFSRGGSNTARNLRLLCEHCNRRKGAGL